MSFFYVIFDILYVIFGNPNRCHSVLLILTLDAPVWLKLAVKSHGRANRIQAVEEYQQAWERPTTTEFRPNPNLQVYKSEK